MISRPFTRAWAGYAFALAATAAVTGLIAVVRTETNVSNISMLYLLAVLAAAVLSGSGPAVFTSVAAFLAYDFFFVLPHYRLAVADTEEWVALGLLLVTGVVTGQLTAIMRERAREARLREREAVVLYDVVRLMAGPDMERSLTAVAERLRAELDLSAVLIVFAKESPMKAQADTGESEAIALAREALQQSGMVLGAGPAPTATARGHPGRWIRVVSPTSRQRERRVRNVPVSVRGEAMGSILVVSRPEAAHFGSADDRLLSAVAHQLGLALERLRLQTEATEAEVLRRTDELRTALINAVSHDLRTPLSSIIASAGSLRQHDVRWTAKESDEFAETIETEAERLNRLVANLLDLSRIEAGSIRPEKSWYDLGSLIEEVAGRLRGVAAGHNLVVDVEEGLPPVLFDFVEIDQVISNLIENAAKYTPPGTEIAVAARRSGDDMQVEVTDRGPGITPSALPRLFDAFYRAPGSGRAIGSGLGLAVAKGLVEAHGGRIWAENREGGGARFVFTLPLTSPEAERPEKKATA